MDGNDPAHASHVQPERWSPSRLLALFMVGLVATIVAALGGFLLAQHQDNDRFKAQLAAQNRQFQRQITIEVQRQISRDSCGLLVALSPTAPDERATSPYGLRIQNGVHESGAKIGCKLPPPP